MAEWRRHGIDVLLRLNEAPLPNLRPLRRLDRNDTLIVWRRPKNRIRHLSPEQWAVLPESMHVRRVETTVAAYGFRTQHIQVLTTLLDEAAYSAESIAALYRDRWMAELNLRSLKTTLNMEVLRGKSPDIVRKEVYMYAVAYNLIRSLMWRAARSRDGDPRRLSFDGARQRITAMAPFLEILHAHSDRVALLQRLLELVAADKLPNRPDRIEPRAVKRRPKTYLRLTQSRSKIRAKLRKTHAA
ncbi:MAG: transposase [Phycisphaerales bacterium]|nr:transposase [Phycisphaerales bacterium]